MVRGLPVVGKYGFAHAKDSMGLVCGVIERAGGQDGSRREAFSSKPDMLNRLASSASTSSRRMSR